MNATTLLKKDHAAVKKLFRRFSDTTPRAAKTRERLVERIAQELEIHATIEEQIFYPAMRQVAGAEEMVEEALQEHQEVKQMLGEIQGMDPTDEALDQRIEQLQADVLHHATEEEREMFVKARELGDAELSRLGQEMAERKKALQAGPTRKAKKAARKVA
jgi:iron-sulfur cluster repair protein YtfE (RIC family)